MLNLWVAASMTATVHINWREHQQLYGEAMAKGLRRHGLTVLVLGHDQTERGADFGVVWGAPSKHPNVVTAVPHVLVMERGHLPDRFKFASVGWDGLGRRGRYPRAQDGGERWHERYRHLLRDWRRVGHALGPALILGQVPIDAAVRGLDVDVWAQAQTDALVALGWPVEFRPHPYAPEVSIPRGATRADGTLDEALRRAAVCVT